MHGRKTNLTSNFRYSRKLGWKHITERQNSLTWNLSPSRKEGGKHA
jgi:hypothetical protein